MGLRHVPARVTDPSQSHFLSPNIMSDVFKWSSTAGQSLCRRILKEAPLDYKPHDCQIDGVNLLTITPTGSRKTSYYIMYILVVLAGSKNPLLCIAAKFPQNPCLIVICPTIPWEQGGQHVVLSCCNVTLQHGVASCFGS
jgi:hypothetical protein